MPLKRLTTPFFGRVLFIDGKILTSRRIAALTVLNIFGYQSPENCSIQLIFTGHKRNDNTYVWSKFHQIAFKIEKVTDHKLLRRKRGCREVPTLAVRRAGTDVNVRPLSLFPAPRVGDTRAGEARGAAAVDVKTPPRRRASVCDTRPTRPSDDFVRSVRRDATAATQPV